MDSNNNKINKKIGKTFLFWGDNQVFDNYHEVFPWTLDFIHGEVRQLSILIVFFVKTTQTLKSFIGTKKTKAFAWNFFTRVAPTVNERACNALVS